MIALLVVRDTALRAACTWLWSATDADTDADTNTNTASATASIPGSLDPFDTEDADTSSIVSSPCAPHTCAYAKATLSRLSPSPSLLRSPLAHSRVDSPPSRVPLAAALFFSPSNYHLFSFRFSDEGETRGVAFRSARLRQPPVIFLEL